MCFRLCVLYLPQQLWEGGARGSWGFGGLQGSPGCPPASAVLQHLQPALAEPFSPVQLLCSCVWTPVRVYISMYLLPCLLYKSLRRAICDGSGGLAGAGPAAAPGCAPLCLAVAAAGSPLGKGSWGGTRPTVQAYP